MRIEQLSDEHGIYFRASEEAFLVSKEQAASIRKYIDELRKLVRMAWKCAHSGLSCSDCRMVAGGCTLQSAMREMGVEI